MRLIRGNNTDPYFNLAAEEYLLLQTDTDVFMLWQNAPSVIIGKNQNAYAEVNRDYTEAQGIKVVRRLTGGGAVFHDPGNVNYTFITVAPAEPQIDFARFAQPIIIALESLGIRAELGGRNDIMAEGAKISGNAQCVYRRKDGTRMLLHHGTLLYDADMTDLAASLRVNGDKLRSKGIKSVSSRVGNIRTMGGLSMTADEFAEYLMRQAEKQFGGSATTLTEAEWAGAAELARTKYSTWEWNFGRSPEYGITRSKRFPYGTVEASLTVDRGVITGVKISGDYFGVEDTATLESALTGVRYDRRAVTAVLESLPVGKVIAGATANEVAELITATQ
ncbi:MAG: lipoate--protein ligase [Clostridia bacterium]|nr:lipoate--protein ligase [Clostridia bacterium]